MVKKTIIFIIILLLLNFILKQDYIYYLRDYVYDTNNNVIVFKEENNALKKEIKELKKLLELKNTNYKLKYASVISRNTKDYFEEVIIDVGKKDGIKENLAVITKDGLIGKIIKVTNKTSTVRLITSSNIYNKISVNIEADNKSVTGIITSYDSLTNSLTIEGITENVNIQTGSLVTTTGLSDIYPSGILVGRVSRVMKDNFDLAYILKVEPTENLSSFHYVAVIVK